MKQIDMRETDSRKAEPQSARRPSTRSTQGRVAAHTAEDISRLFVTATIAYISRIEREKRALYGSDLDLASVFEAVSVGAMEPALRDPGFRAAYASFNAIVGVDGQRGINAMSVSAATGIPRETVRRKLKRLLERGYIVEKTKGHYVVAPGRLQDGDYQAAFARGIRETVRFMNQCFEQGLVQWVTEEPKKDPDKAR